MVDVNHPPKGGFKTGEWYWDPQAQQARQFWNGTFGPAGFIHPESNQQGAGQAVSEEVRRQSGYVGTVGSGGSSNGGSSQSQSMSPFQSVNQIIQDSFQKLQNEVVKRFGEYQSGKPFKIDEILAQKKIEAGEQIDPYYDQILGDYMLGVTRKINRGVDDTKQLLDELSASTSSYKENAQNVLSTAIESAQSGFADAGLFGSGDQLSADGKLKQNYGSNMTDYLRKADIQQNQLTTGLSRNIQDINAEKKGYVTNLEQNRFTDINTRAGQLASEAGQQYVQGFQATLPAELQSASGFDMLKSLGIYS